MAQPLPFLVNAINSKKICDISSIIEQNNESTWNTSNRKIIIMRHGERVDTTFGKRWLEVSFNEHGEYFQRDLNMPKKLPNRKHRNDWINDVPLTNVGEHQAFLTGDAMQEAGVEIAYAYSSPVFRCVQTCSAFLAGIGLKNKVQIRIEPGFFQYVGWEGIINMLTPEELYAAGFNIDLNYKPILSRKNLTDNINQSLEDHYNLGYQCIQSILKINDNGNIYICGHADSLDVCSRQLIGHSPGINPETEIQNLITSVQFCSLLTVEEVKKNNWKIIPSPCPPITHGFNKRFDHKILQS